MKKLVPLLCCVLLCALATAGHRNRVCELHAKGLRRDPAKHAQFKRSRAILKKRAVFQLAPVAARYDLSPFVSPPEDQGACGDCWNFALLKALRSQYMLAGHDPGRLEWNFLLNNCGKGPAQWGCSGGDFDAGLSLENGGGPGLDRDNPYTAKDGGACMHLGVAATGISYNIIGAHNRRPTFEELASVISSRHVLVVDVAACDALERYSGGIFSSNDCGPSDINHMLNAVGYDCETSVDANGNCVFNAAGEPVNGDGFLIGMNQWKDTWGEGGYIRTRAHASAFADTAMYFEITAGSPVPPPPPAPRCTRFLCPWWCTLPWCN